MNFRYVSVWGSEKRSGKRRKKTIMLHNSKPVEEALNHPDIADNLLPPFEYQEITHKPPTSFQISQAQQEGIEVVDGMDKNDLDVLLMRRILGDTDPNPGLVEFADQKHLAFSNYLGKKGLYDLVFKELPLPGKAAFFCFSIYRYLSNDREANLEKSPYRQRFYDFGNHVVSDDKFVRSLNGYSGSDLRFFGKLIIKKEPDEPPREVQGGSVETYAFGVARNYLEQFFTLPSSNTKLLDGTKPSAISGKKGCLLPIFVALATVVSILAAKL